MIRCEVGQTKNHFASIPRAVW